jgi:hypothetical protein
MTAAACAPDSSAPDPDSRASPATFDEHTKKHKHFSLICVPGGLLKPVLTPPQLRHPAVPSAASLGLWSTLTAGAAIVVALCAASTRLAPPPAVTALLAAKLGTWVMGACLACSVA